MSLPNIFFEGIGGCLFTSIKFRSQGITRSDGNRITSAFSKCGLWVSGDDFPFLTSYKIWVLINLTFGFIVCRGHTRMRMKPASWEERGHYRVVSRSVGPSSQGCTCTCRSWAWWEPYRWHTPASVHLFTPGIQISPLTFAWLCWILEPGFCAIQLFCAGFQVPWVVDWLRPIGPDNSYSLAACQLRELLRAWAALCPLERESQRAPHTAQWPVRISKAMGRSRRGNILCGLL